MYLYRAELDRLIGPVSMSVTIDLGFRMNLTVPVRLDGVTQPMPEERGAAQQVAADWLAGRESFVVQVIKDKRQTFGRWFAVVMDDEDGSTLNAALVESGLVGRYESGAAPEPEAEDLEPTRP